MSVIKCSVLNSFLGLFVYGIAFKATVSKPSLFVSGWSYIYWWTPRLKVWLRPHFLHRSNVNRCFCFSVRPQLSRLLAASVCASHLKGTKSFKSKKAVMMEYCHSTSGKASNAVCEAECLVVFSRKTHSQTYVDTHTHAHTHTHTNHGEWHPLRAENACLSPPCWKVPAVI